MRFRVSNLGCRVSASGTCWDALGVFWKFSKRFGTLWQLSGDLRDALERSRGLLEASKTLWKLFGSIGDALPITPETLGLMGGISGVMGKVWGVMGGGWRVMGTV